MHSQEIPPAVEQCIEKCRHSSAAKFMSDYTGALRLLAQELMQKNASEEKIIEDVMAKQRALEKRSTRLVQKGGSYTPIERGEKRHAPRHYSVVDDPEPSESIDFYGDEHGDE